MYDACDDSGNYYLIMDSIVDYWNNDKSITVPDKNVVHRGLSFMRRSTVGWKIFSNGGMVIRHDRHSNI